MNKGRKISGGRYIKSRKKKRFELAGQKRIVKLGEEKRKSQRTRGGKLKVCLLNAKFANIRHDGKTKKVEIKNVLETPSNKFLARQNVITKGTIIETEIGKARVTNRPSQEGSVQAILIK